MIPRGKTYARCGLIAKNVEGELEQPPPPPGLIRVKVPTSSQATYPSDKESFWIVSIMLLVLTSFEVCKPCTSTHTSANLTTSLQSQCQTKNTPIDIFSQLQGQTEIKPSCYNIFPLLLGYPPGASCPGADCRLHVHVHVHVPDNVPKLRHTVPKLYKTHTMQAKSNCSFLMINIFFIKFTQSSGCNLFSVFLLCFSLLE